MKSREDPARSIGSCLAIGIPNASWSEGMAGPHLVLFKRLHPCPGPAAEASGRHLPPPAGGALAAARRGGLGVLSEPLPLTPEAPPRSLGGPVLSEASRGLRVSSSGPSQADSGHVPNTTAQARHSGSAAGQLAGPQQGWRVDGPGPPPPCPHSSNGAAGMCLCWFHPVDTEYWF